MEQGAAFTLRMSNGKRTVDLRFKTEDAAVREAERIWSKMPVSMKKRYETTPGTKFMVMDCDGRDLYDYIREVE